MPRIHVTWCVCCELLLTVLHEPKPSAPSSCVFYGEMEAPSWATAEPNAAQCLHCRRKGPGRPHREARNKEAFRSNGSCLGASHLLVPLLEMLSLSLFESVSSNFTCRFLREPSRTAPGPPPCPPSPRAMTSSFTWSQSMSVLSTAMRSGTTSVLFGTETQCLPRPRHLSCRRCASQYFE